MIKFRIFPKKNCHGTWTSNENFTLEGVKQGKRRVHTFACNTHGHANIHERQVIINLPCVGNLVLLRILLIRRAAKLTQKVQGHRKRHEVAGTATYGGPFIILSLGEIVLTI